MKFLPNSNLCLTHLIFDMRLTSDEAKKVLEFYYASHKSPTRAFRQFNTWAQHNNCATRITKKNVIDTVRRFQCRTTLQKDTKMRLSKSQDEGLQMDVLSSLYQQRGSSLRTCAGENKMEDVRCAVTSVPHRLERCIAVNGAQLHHM